MNHPNHPNFSCNFSSEESELPKVDTYYVSPDVPEKVYIASSVFMVGIGLFGVISNFSVFFLFCKSSLVSIHVHTPNYRGR